MRGITLIAFSVVTVLLLLGVLLFLYEPAEHPHRTPMDWESFAMGFLCATLIMPLAIQCLRDWTIGG